MFADECKRRAGILRSEDAARTSLCLLGESLVFFRPPWLSRACRRRCGGADGGGGVPFPVENAPPTSSRRRGNEVVGKGSRAHARRDTVGCAGSEVNDGGGRWGADPATAPRPRVVRRSRARRPDSAGASPGCLPHKSKVLPSHGAREEVRRWRSEEHTTLPCERTKVRPVYAAFLRRH